MVYRVDLHVHTPYSSCYEDHVRTEAKLNTSPQAIVNTSLAAGLEAIVITDHNTAEGIDPIREAAAGSGLCVLPGMELSARGGHVLALFDRDYPVSGLRSLLRSLGFEEENQGEGYFQTNFWLDEVFRRIEESGGLAIAAHIDRQPRGFIASDESLADKMRIHSSKYLSALEVTRLQDRVLWNQGLMPNFPKKYACVQGSDAHALSEIGRRFIYLDIPSLTLEGLRIAFREYEARVKFPEEISSGVNILRAGGSKEPHPRKL